MAFHGVDVDAEVVIVLEVDLDDVFLLVVVVKVVELLFKVSRPIVGAFEVACLCRRR